MGVGLSLSALGKQDLESSGLSHDKQGQAKYGDPMPPFP